VETAAAAAVVEAAGEADTNGSQRFVVKRAGPSGPPHIYPNVKTERRGRSFTLGTPWGNGESCSRVGSKSENGVSDMPKKGKSRDRVARQKKFEKLEKERERARKKAEKIAKKVEKTADDVEQPAE
jgi:hypothetical protein